MTIRDAISLFGDHQRSNLKARTVQSYSPLLQRFEARFVDRSFDSIGSDEIYHFLETLLVSFCCWHYRQHLPFIDLLPTTLPLWLLIILDYFILKTTRLSLSFSFFSGARDLASTRNILSGSIFPSRTRKSLTFLER